MLKVIQSDSSVSLRWNAPELLCLHDASPQIDSPLRVFHFTRPAKLPRQKFEPRSAATQSTPARQSISSLFLSLPSHWHRPVTATYILTSILLSQHHEVHTRVWWSHLRNRQGYHCILDGSFVEDSGTQSHRHKDRSLYQCRCGHNGSDRVSD